jgi:hypothetical protein
MEITCSRLQACFVDPGIEVEIHGPTAMVWDEHGGTFVLRLGGLHVADLPAPAGESGVRLEISLTSEGLEQALEEFASLHQLPLAAALTPELAEPVILAACHLPGQNLFVFAEDPTLVAQKRGDTVELAVAGTFKARRLPCQEPDLVVHLSKAAMTRLVAYVHNQARAGC